jgi:hypothetical protein
LAWGDAFRSLELMEASTSSDTAAGELAERDDPLEAARTWLMDPEHSRSVPEDVRDRAVESLDVAAVHLHQLDVLAGEVAREANDAGDVDPLRLDQVDAMAALVRTYSEKLRELLDPATLEAEHASERLDRGLDAARNGGGLGALVAALS